MFVKIENNKIISIANAKMDNDYQETDKEVVKGFDHTFYFLEETKTPEYLARKKEYEEKQYLNELRVRRETECFSVINRGQLWYITLTEKQINDLDKWYQDWLNVTETKVIPEKPEWII